MASRTAPKFNQIPLVDVGAQLSSLEVEIHGAIKRVLDSGVFVGGEEVEAFEEEFAAICTAAACAAVGNGTDALYLTLRALGIGPGDEVVTVPNTFIATIEAITRTGARPVFVDVTPQTLGMDPDRIQEVLSPRCRAILPVHLYGLPVAIDAINAVAAAEGLAVVEDAAQAHGATIAGKTIGRLGVAGCFSFYPAKNLGALGDGGAVVSDDVGLIERVRMLGNHGRREKHIHELEGVNSRLDALQAAVLRVKLPHLTSWNAARRERAQVYREALEGLPMVQLLRPAPGVEPVWHLYVIQVEERDALRARLANDGIATGIHYPVPMHLQPAYASLGYGSGTFPVAETAAKRILSLPLYPELPLESVRLIAGRVRAFYGEN